MMRCQAVIFDLDGTLLDTLDDLAASVNRVLASQGFPMHARDAFRWFIGDGSAKLMERALPLSARTPERIASCLQHLLDDYNQNWHHATQPYEGISSLLQTLEARNIQIAIVTNKPHRFTHVMIDYYFSRVPFRYISGQRTGVPKKPDPQEALAAAQSMAVTPGACIFLGDSAVDMQAARSAGMMAVGAGWGFRPARELWDAGATQVLADPLDLLIVLDR